MFLRSSLNQLKGSKSEKQTMEFYQLSNEHSKKSQRKKPEQDLLDKDTIKIDKQPKKLLNKNTENNSQIETSPLPLLTKRKQKKPQQMKDCSDEEVYFEQASPLLYKKKKQQQLSNDCSEEEIEAASTNLKKPKQLQRKHSKDQSDEDLQQKFAREQNLPSRSKHQTSRSNCSYYEDDNAADDEEEEEQCYSSNNACLFQKSINSKASHSSVSSRFDAGEGESKRVDLTSFVTRTYGDALPAEKINQEVDECIQLAKKQIAQKSQITEQRAQQLKKQFPKLFCLIHRKLYETEEKYVQHTIKYHPDVAIEENLAGFKCLKCLRIFVSYGWWEKHIILCQGLAEKLATLSNSDRKLFLLGLRIKSTM